jgi:predicted CXXCH cytochrome family protein
MIFETSRRFENAVNLAVNKKRRDTMKKILVVLLVIAIALVGASAAMATIANSKHDLSSTSSASYVGGTMSSCQYCHTPHHGAGGPAPLWNRVTSAATYSLYGGGVTLAGSVVNAPGANSQTCLSCHDGTIAVGSVINGAADVITKAGVLDATGRIIGAAALIGPDLRDDHPIGVVYDTTKTLAGLGAIFDTATGQVKSGKNWKVYGTVGNQRVECGSCHDPHSTTNAPFLKDTLSTMCADCHATK